MYVCMYVCAKTAHDGLIQLHVVQIGANRKQNMVLAEHILAVVKTKPAGDGCNSRLRVSHSSLYASSTVVQAL